MESLQDAINLNNVRYAVYFYFERCRIIW